MSRKTNQSGAAVQHKKSVKKGFFRSTLGIGILCAAASLIMIVRGISVQPDITANKNTIESLNAQIEAEKARQAEVDEMRANADTDEYIEQVARDRLGMIKNDEIVFIDVSEK